jgi:hypothetical protein
VSNITGVNKDLIHHMYVILQVISSCLHVNKTEFSKYSIDTAKMYVNLYGWYYMPSSVHIILIHGKAIIESKILPIGWMSEEAQEARNKDFKRFRLCNSRKNSRISTNTDVMNNLLISSDPFISGLRPQWVTRKPLQLEEDAKKMLLDREDIYDDSDEDDRDIDEDLELMDTE